MYPLASSGELPSMGFLMLRGVAALVIGAGTLFGPSLLRAADVPSPGPAVVELFTSEGCDSCPPAEAVLGSLAGRPGLLTLAFHVTYWDSAAWRDAYGLAEAVDRQARYARQLRLPSAYTPQAVVNGRTDVLGSDAMRLSSAVSQLPRPAGVVGRRSPQGVVWQLPGLEGSCPCRLELISVRPSAETRVGGGENSGRDLHEVRIVRSIRWLGAWDGRASDRVVQVSDLPKDAASVVLLASSERDGSILVAGEAVL